VSVFKRCGCAKSPDCNHLPFHLKIWHEGKIVAVGPTKKFARHLVGEQRDPVTRKEAEHLENTIANWYARGCPPLDSPTAPTAPDVERKFTPTFAEYRKRHLSKLAESGDRVRAFEARWKSQPLSIVLDIAALEDYFDDRRDDDEVGPASINRDYSCLSHFVNWCMNRDYLVGKRPFYNRTSNTHGIKKMNEGDGRFRRLLLADPEHELERFHASEEDRILKAIDSLAEAGEEMRGRFYCAVDAGLRKGEMLALQRDAIDWHHRDGVMMRVYWHTSKGKRDRLVPVGPARLLDYLKARRFAQFPFGDATGARIESFQTVWNTVRERAQIDNLTWHDLRHESGSRFAEGHQTGKQMVVHELMIVMGHTSIKTTQRYLNPRLSSIAANVRAVFSEPAEPEKRGRR